MKAIQTLIGLAMLADSLAVTTGASKGNGNYSKLPLTPKQKSKRAKAKAAKQARKRNK